MFKINSTHSPSSFFAPTAPLDHQQAPTAPEGVVDRPLLTSPDSLPFPQLSVFRLLAETDNIRRVGDEILNTLSLRISNVKDSISAISAEKIQLLKEAAKRASSSDFWSLLKKIATTVMAAFSIVLGISLVASGGAALIGGAMIASGVLSLANFALSESGTWDLLAEKIAHDNEDLKGKLKIGLPVACGILAGGIGLVGSAHSIATGAVNFFDKAILVAQTVISLMDGVTTLGKGISDGRLLFTTADLKKNEAELTIERKLFDGTIEEIKGSMNDFKAVKAKAKKAFEMIAESNIQLVRQV